jgi:hypothetical protein
MADTSNETPMVARVNYSREGAGDLVQYIERGADRGLRDETGRRLSDEDRDRFVRRSEEREFTRSVVLSVPEHAEADLSDRAMGRETRRTMNEQLQSAPSARYIYGIHEDTDHRHAHVALTGAEHDLTWDRDDLDRLRERVNERFIERHREIEWEFQQAHEQGADRDFGRG